MEGFTPPSDGDVFSLSPAATAALAARAAAPSVPPAEAIALGRELHEAVKAKDAEECFRLLGAGADLAVKDDFGNAALSVACKFSNIELALALAACPGVDVGAKNNDGATALMRCAGKGFVSLVAALLSKGADMNATDKDGDTPLYWACWYSHAATALQLISAGADVNRSRKSAVAECGDNVKMASVKAALLAAGALDPQLLSSPASALSASATATPSTADAIFLTTPSTVVATGPGSSSDASPSVAAPLHATINWSTLTPTPPSAASPPLQGGMGIVFHATWKKTPRALAVPVAVKLLKAALLSGEQLRDAAAALENEAAAMAAANGGALTNAHVAVMYGLARGAPPSVWQRTLGVYSASLVGFNGDLIGLVTRWEAGGSLHDLLHAPGRVWAANTAMRLHLCADVADGLAHLHGGDPCVLHGDIKPENVLLSQPVTPNVPPQPVLSDFGLSSLREMTASGSRVSLAVTATAPKRGTFHYMAPEMLEQEDDSVAILGPSRSTDVYALATLCWEVLSGDFPWAGLTEGKRAMVAWKGKILPLTSPPLPPDTPATVVDLLARCLGHRSSRPLATNVSVALRAAAQELSSGAFDIFLSHAWAADGRHEALTTAVYAGLLAAGFRVWIDTLEMGHDLDGSMQRGIAASGVVVALLSDRYESSTNCKKELQWAKRQGKPIVACLAENALSWFPAKTSAVLEILGGANTLFPDLRPAAGVDWAPSEGAEVSASQRGLLTRAENALPLVVKLALEAASATKKAEIDAMEEATKKAERDATEEARSAIKKVESDSMEMEPALAEMGNNSENAQSSATVAVGIEFAPLSPSTGPDFFKGFEEAVSVLPASAAAQPTSSAGVTALGKGPFDATVKAENAEMQNAAKHSCCVIH